MTDPNQEELVEQVDRDAAADWNRKGWREAKAIREGRRDNHPLVQSFARHRIAALRSAGGQGMVPSEALALARLIVEDVSHIRDPARLSPRTVGRVAYLARKLVHGDGNSASPAPPEEGAGK